MINMEITREAIHRYFEEHTEDLLNDLAAMVAVESARGPALPGKPFGEGPAQALALAERLISEAGFKAVNHDNYVVTGDMNESETILNILAHLDIVPVGTGWTRPPLTLTREGNALYGRGAADNKGPAIAVLYAMKCLRELGAELSSNCRLILGADEECGSGDLRYYFSKHTPPRYTVTPDAGYPIINTEKGRLELTADGSWSPGTSLPRLRGFKGGVKINVVPAEAEAEIEGLSSSALAPFLATAEKETCASFTAEEQNGKTLIHVKGQSSHAAWPDTGVNGITALLTLLSALPLAEDRPLQALKGISALFPHGEADGHSAGIAMSDEISGPLTIALTVLELREDGLHLEADCRAPLCANDGNVTDVLRERLGQIGLTAGENRMLPSHHTPADSPLCKALIEIYEAYTGRKGECIAIGGGTYVHNIEGGVGFGCDFPEDRCGAHGPDEHASLKNLLLSGEMYAQLILTLCGGRSASAGRRDS